MVDRASRSPFENSASWPPNVRRVALGRSRSRCARALLFDRGRSPGREMAEPGMVHGLAHRGTATRRARSWSDLWLNEGHATWYERTYEAEFLGLDFERCARPRPVTRGRPWRAERPVAVPAACELLRAVQRERLRRRYPLLYALHQVIGAGPSGSLARGPSVTGRVGRARRTSSPVRPPVGPTDLGQFLRGCQYDDGDAADAGPSQLGSPCPIRRPRRRRGRRGAMQCSSSTRAVGY